MGLFYEKAILHKVGSLTHKYGCSAERVHDGLPDGDFLYGHKVVSGLGVQHKVHDHGNDGDDNDQDAEEEAAMRLRTVHREVVSGLLVDRLQGGLAGPVNVWYGFDRLPHFVEDHGADQRVLDGAGEKKRRQLLGT